MVVRYPPLEAQSYSLAVREKHAKMEMLSRSSLLFKDTYYDRLLHESGID